MMSGVLCLCNIFQLIMPLSIKALFLNKSQAGDAYESDILFVRQAVAKRFCGSL